MWLMLVRWLAPVAARIKWAGAAIAAVVLAWLAHKGKVKHAGRQGRRQGAELERDRIATETRRTETRIQDRVREIERQIDADTADIDDLRRRMRQGSQGGE